MEQSYIEMNENEKKKCMYFSIYLIYPEISIIFPKLTLKCVEIIMQFGAVGTILWIIA